MLGKCIPHSHYSTSSNPFDFGGGGSKGAREKLQATQSSSGLRAPCSSKASLSPTKVDPQGILPCVSSPGTNMVTSPIQRKNKSGIWKPSAMLEKVQLTCNSSLDTHSVFQVVLGTIRAQVPLPIFMFLRSSFGVGCPLLNKWVSFTHYYVRPRKYKHDKLK